MTIYAFLISCVLPINKPIVTKSATNLDSLPPHENRIYGLHMNFGPTGGRFGPLAETFLPTLPRKEKQARFSPHSNLEQICQNRALSLHCGQIERRLGGLSVLILCPQGHFDSEGKKAFTWSS